jgi:hypothetical protein
MHGMHHWDPAVELKLQRIRDLRTIINRKQAQLDRDYASIAELRDWAHRQYGRGNITAPGNMPRMANELQEKVGATESEILALHERIENLSAEMSTDELGYL